MSVPRFTWDSRDMTSTSTPNESLIDIGGISPDEAKADAESNYERGYRAGYTQATADILKTIKEYYGQ